MQSRRTWLKAHAAQAKAAETGAATVAKAEGGKTIAAIASSALAPLAGVLAGILAFVLAMMVVSQLISALFGFWENEASKQSLAGLPPYITQEMVVTALECQEKYGHPAGCTIAQIICESGVGDHLSGLATQDNNLFGIKWASSYGLAEEVTGHSSWQTGEEYNGQHVTIMDEFTSFKSHKDCIIFRSRVFLQNSRYSQNALIKEAMEKHDSDKMAEGLKDAGYATSSEYVQTLQSIMKTYNLYRFDGMTVEQYESMAANGDAIVQAAYSQLGVPYVWGGETPGVGLDCSGLTMYCYSTVGISIPHYTEDQYAMGTPKLLSEAQPGDILYKPGHVAIYVGGDQYIHEPHTGAVCTLATGINYFTCALSFR
ncbi:C40 family peptidase [Paraeggerthella hongkongensis]|nr:C40 family peptidase [Paraeggerthella hongkongensis]